MTCIAHFNCPTPEEHWTSTALKQCSCFLLTHRATSNGTMALPTSNLSFPSAGPVRLCVGGKFFTTDVSTLQKADYFQALAQGEIPTTCLVDAQGNPQAFFIDRDPDMFQHILTNLRSQHVPSHPNADFRQRLVEEATFWGVADLVAALVASSELDKVALEYKDVPWSDVVQYLNKGWQLDEKYTGQISVYICEAARKYFPHCTFQVLQTSELGTFACHCGKVGHPYGSVKACQGHIETVSEIRARLSCPSNHQAALMTSCS